MRENLVARLKRGGELFPGIVGYEDTVIPQMVNAVLSKHNFILLGLLGQAKSRLLRALGTLLDASATHIGLVFTTNDAGSATSLDNLGFSGAGPAGVNGAAMPFLTVTTVPTDPPVWDKPQLGCQSAIAKSGSKLASTVHKNLVKCLDGVLKAAAAGGDYADITAKCTAALDPANPSSKVGKSIAKLQASLTSKCGSLTPLRRRWSGGAPRHTPSARRPRRPRRASPAYR